MLLDLSLPLALFALAQPANAPAEKPDAEKPADPSSEPQLEVPELENDVLGTKEEKALDSLNPPAPSEKKEKAEEKSAPDLSQAKPSPQEKAEFQYGTADKNKETFGWGTPSRDQEPLPFADKKVEQEPMAFAPASNPGPEGDASIQSHRLRSKYRGFQATKQRFALHFKMGPYLPEIDKGDAQGPYAKIFGKVNQQGLVIKAPPKELIYWLGFEWQFWHLAGPLSVGLDVGFFSDSATARLANPGAPVQPAPGVDPASVLAPVSPADKNQFTFVPVAALVGYRFSYLADKTPVPLVPYARAGLNYNFWWTNKGSGQLVRDPAGKKVRGGILGWQVNLGLALRLNGIFRQAGRMMDSRFGINHVSLFGEFAISRSGIGGKKVNLGDKTFYGGLLVEF